MLELTHHSLSSNLLIFAVSACGVWLCGTKLSRYVDLIAADLHNRSDIPPNSAMDNE